MKSVYIVCLLNSRHWENISHDLEIRGYKGILPIIPKIKIFKNLKVGKVSYEYKPLLFEYGFLKMSSKKAYNRAFLRRLCKDIPGIKYIVKDTISIFPKKKRKRIDNAGDFDDFSKVATVSKENIERLLLIAEKNSVFNKEDIIQLSPGDYVILKNYPFEGIPALIGDISLNTKMATVHLYPDSSDILVKIPLDSILYSPYRDIEVPSDVVPINKETHQEYLLNNLTY